MHATLVLANSVRTITVDANTTAKALQEVSWFGHGAWLLEHGYCKIPSQCKIQEIQGLALLFSLCAAILLVVCAFMFFREDKEEQITPLTPQLVVNNNELSFKLPLRALFDRTTDKQECQVLDFDDRPICKVSLEWADQQRPGGTGVAVTAKLTSNAELPLATVVARNVAIVGQGLALVRPGCDIFGFVEPEGARRYAVRHRAGVHLMTFIGDFDSIEVVGINPVGSKVCWFTMLEDGECRGRVLPHVDAGLMITSLLATYMHQRLLSGAQSPTTQALLPASLPASPLLAAKEAKEEEDAISESHADTKSEVPTEADAADPGSSPPIFRGEQGGRAAALLPSPPPEPAPPERSEK